MKKRPDITVREISALALLGALMFALQVAMSGLPNIHVTAVLIIISAVFFSWRCLYAVAVFIMLEGLVWGINIWWISYWYAWPLLAAAAVLLRKNDSPLTWAVLAAAHGLCFGALCSLPYIFIGGFKMAFSTWIAGIPYDLAHCGGNFVLTLVLFKPLKKAAAAALKRG